MAYATEQELIDTLGLTEAPTNAGELLELASEFIDRLTLNRTKLIDPVQDEELYNKIKRATIYQVDHWLTYGEDMDIDGIQSISFGSFSLTMGGGGGGKLPLVSTKVWNILWPTGLLHRGVPGCRSRNLDSFFRTT